MPLEYDTVHELIDEIYDADSLTYLFESVPAIAGPDYLKMAGFVHLIWCVQEFVLATT